MNNHETPAPQPVRFKLVNGGPQHFSEAPTVILRDYETQLEYPFATRASALRARVSILDGSASMFVSAPFHLNAYDRVLTTLEPLS